jgi:hypothetical protein
MIWPRAVHISFEILQGLPDGECGDAGGSRQFSRVNCRGKLETRVSAYRLPGLCGLPLQSAL